MNAMFHEVFADMNHPTAWSLGKIRSRNADIDPRSFTRASHVESPGRLSIAIEEHGEPMAFSFSLAFVPIVTTRVAELIDQIAPGAAERFPIEVDGSASGYEVLNVIRVIDAIDRRRSVYNLWKPEDGRPDKIGNFRGVDRMVLKDDLKQDIGIFRPMGWTVILVVSRALKNELLKIPNLGVQFTPIEGGHAST